MTKYLWQLKGDWSKCIRVSDTVPINLIDSVCEHSFMEEKELNIEVKFSIKWKMVR